ncbi:MAG TPA: sensor histidine kinase [Caldithrix abyssi]|uniref:histidine kinase n=1 Tax=Caldithrix abyssi TaxID=187145 RepID=A0A7V4TYF8_CALAY|nr:sensor histidine kinase [Caldithrix abyssi]
MQNIFKTFYGRLSLLFLVLLVLLGAAQIVITATSWSRYYKEADQRLNLTLAADMAKEIEPLLKDSLDIAAIGHTIHYMMVLNPKIEIYVVDGNGHILAFFAEPNKKVKTNYIDLQPVNQFLSGDFQIPIVGDDPRHPGLQKPFSAASLKIGKDINGYLYVILGGELYDSAFDAIRESYITKTIIRGLVITLLFAGIIGLVLFFFLTRRLREMNDVVKQFEQGQLDRRVPVTKKDEIGQLAGSFNKMAETIVANIEELKATDRLRRELIANISHDLRTPLASILGYLETIRMKGDKLSPEEKNNFIKVIEDTASGMRELVEQLFDLSKLDARQVQPHPEPFSVKDLIYDVMMKFKPQADKTGIAINIQVPDGLPQVYADIALIERVLSNLVENALRYTPAGGTVTIATASQKEQIEIRVMDTGVGIAKEDLPYIFERFFRIERSRAAVTGGTGLGLAIAKKIMDIHNSTLKVTSKLNAGSTFFFRLAVWSPRA